jgi:hypothetical protein
MKNLFVHLLLLGGLVFGSQSAWSETVTLAYSQGAASPTSFNPSTGNIGINIGIPGVAKVDSVKFFGDFSFASTGTFSTQNRSNVTFTGPNTPLAAPGQTTLWINHQPISSSFSENTPGVSLSAGADVNWSTFFNSGTISVVPLDIDLAINMSKSGSGALGSTLSDSDSATATRVALGAGLGPVDIATVGASPQISGSSSVKFGSAINAVVRYQHLSDASINGTKSVSINGLTGVSVDLPVAGLYDITLSDFRLSGKLTSTKTPGVTLDLTVLNDVVADRFLGIPATSRTKVDSFQLSSGKSLGFSIAVIPEPGCFALCSALGLVSIAVRRRRSA